MNYQLILIIFLLIAIPMTIFFAVYGSMESQKVGESAESAPIWWQKFRASAAPQEIYIYQGTVKFANTGLTDLSSPKLFIDNKEITSTITYYHKECTSEGILGNVTCSETSNSEGPLKPNDYLVFSFNSFSLEEMKVEHKVQVVTDHYTTMTYDCSTNQELCASIPPYSLNLIITKAPASCPASCGGVAGISGNLSDNLYRSMRNIRVDITLSGSTPTCGEHFVGITPPSKTLSVITNSNGGFGTDIITDEYCTVTILAVSQTSPVAIVTPDPCTVSPGYTPPY